MEYKLKAGSYGFPNRARSNVKCANCRAGIKVKLTHLSDVKCNHCIGYDRNYRATKCRGD